MRFFYRLVPLLLVFLIVSACGQNTPQGLPTLVASPTAIPATTTPFSDQTDNTAIQPTSDPTAKPGTVRIIHAAADTAAINISAGFLTIATNLDFTQATEPTPLDAGAYTIEIMPSGSRPGEPALFETTYTLKSGASDILVLAKQDGQFQLLSFPETVVPLNPGESAISVINAVSGAASVSLRQNGADLTNALAFGQSATSGILPSGVASLTIESGAGSATPYEIDLQEQQAYTLVLTGQSDAVSVASYSTQAPGRATVRAVNALESNTPIDVYLDDALFAQAVEFARPTQRQNIVSGDYNVTAYPAGADRTTADPLISQILTLEADGNNTLVFIGTSNKTVIVPFNEDLSATPPGKARIAFLNTMESVATLRVETSGGPIVEDTGFGQAPEQTLLDANSYIFFLTRAGAPDASRTVETVENVQLEQGNYYLYLATGQQEGQPVILSEDIGFDEALANINPDDITSDSTENPIQLRFINAIADQTPIDFKVNSQPIATSIAFGGGSELLSIEQTNATIEAVVTGSGDFLQSSENSLESGSRYTVIAYGADRSSVRMMVVPDNELIFDGSSPHLRLINLSVNSDTHLGLGFSAQDPTPESGVPAAPNEDIRRSIPGGVQRLIDDIPGSEISSIVLMPTGIYDIEILDSNTDQLATTFSNIALDSGVHYDIIVYEESESIRIRGFVVVYPTDSGN